MWRLSGSLALTLVLSIGSAALAAEVDQFTLSDKALADSEALIDQRANQYLKQAIANVNKSSQCSETKLYKEMKKYFGNHIKGKLILEMNESTEFATQSMDVSSSIYKEWKVKNGLLLSGAFAKAGTGLGKVIRVGNHVIGVDKFEHMFGRGFSYFKDYYKQGKSLKETIMTGSRWERFYFGGYPLFTGVFSYADLVANFNGMRFWNDILALNEDPMDDVKGPYVACENGQFKQVKELRLGAYVDEGFNERINCSQLATHDGAQKVLRALSKSGKDNDAEPQNFCNPESPEMKRLKAKYKELSPLLLNDRGISKVDYFQVN